MSTPESVIPPVLIEDCRLIFRNFAGEEGQFNRQGDRQFSVVLPPEVAAKLVEDGWNVKFLEPREEGDEVTAYLTVAVSYKYRPPVVVIVTENARTPLTEETIGTLDFADIVSADLIFRPFNWNVNGKMGIKAYLQSLYVKIIEDPLAAKYRDVGA